MKQRESLGGYIAFLIVSVLTVAMGLWAFFGNLGDMREYSATAEATVVAPGYEHVERECGANSCHNVTYCTIDYRFTDAEGIEQEGTFDGQASCRRASYREGARREVYFDPDHSYSSTLRNPRGFGLNLLIHGFMLLSFAMLGFAIYLFVGVSRRRARAARPPIPGY